LASPGGSAGTPAIRSDGLKDATSSGPRAQNNTARRFRYFPRRVLRASDAAIVRRDKI
jgi:hypothetical protein